MKSSLLVTLSLSAIAALGLAAQASAQTAKPAPAAPVITATIPGLCVLSREGLVGGSTVGGYVSQRIKELAAVVQSELSSDQTSLQTDAKALDAQKATLTSDAYNQRGAALQQRYNDLQKKAQQREREMQATEQKAVARVMQEASPLVSEIVVQKSCAVVLDAQAVLTVNPTLDITPAVVQALNGKITQFAFDREHLDQQPGQ